MSETLEHVAYLSQEIGPRPAGTEEEQQAALYITERLQKDAGLSTVIEDFNGAANPELARAICGGVLLLAPLLGAFLPVAAIPSIIIAVLAAALLAAEAFGKPILSRLLQRGVSQNVVAKYEPGVAADGNSRRRKVVLVARYDSGKIAPELNGSFVRALPILKWVELGAAFAVVLFALIHGVFFLNATDTVAIVFKVLLIVSAVVACLPLAAFIAHKAAAYNEGANCNAAGVAVLLDVATRIGRGRVSESELSEREHEAVMHGEEAAREAGLVPEGAQLVYEATQVKEPELAPQSAAERLSAAKAAVAALTGQPVSPGISLDLASNLVQVKDPLPPAPTDERVHDQRAETFAALSGAAAMKDDSAADGDRVDSETVMRDDATPAVEEPSIAVAPSNETGASSGDVPAWFKSAQEKAKKRPSSGEPFVQRSRYADALDAAVRESSAHFAHANQAVVSETEQRLQAMRDSIMEVKAPAYARDEDFAASSEAEPPRASSDEAAVEAAADGIPAVFEDAAVESARADEGAAAPEVDAGATIAFTPAMAAALGQTPGASLDEEEGVSPEPESQPVLQPFAPSVVDAAQAGAGDSLLQSTIAMPAVGGSLANVPVVEVHKQAAPLADGGSKPKAANNLRTLLPSISGTIPAVAPISAPHPAAMSVDALRTTLPSLSGTLAPIDDAALQARANGAAAPETAGDGSSARAPHGAVGGEAASGDLFDDGELYIDDVNDSAYEGSLTETGAFAGPGYVDMPKSRAGRLFGRFRKDKKRNSDARTTTEWLDVDESFDARSVGAARGGWESFRDDDAPQPAYVDGQFDDQFDDASVDFDVVQESYDDEPNSEEAYGSVAPAAKPKARGKGRRWHGGAFSRRMMMGRADDVPSEEIGAEEPAPVVDEVIDEEIGQVYRFRHPDIDTEVWFVALGAELEGHAGMRSFLAEHAQDLRGAVIVELDALGAGEMSLVDREGAYRAAKTSSRMKRYVKKASQELGANVPSVDLRWEDSSASFAVKQGFQAMHLVGIDNGKPAFLGQKDDVVENVDSESLEFAADFVMEVLKNI